MSVTGVTGRFMLERCQCAPLSNEMYMPHSVPAYSKPGAHRDLRARRAPAHPPRCRSCRRSASSMSCRSRRSDRCTARNRPADNDKTHSTRCPARCGLGSMFCTRPPGGMSFGVTFVHVLPVVARHIEHAIVRSGPDQPLLHRRFADRVERAVDLFTGRIARDRLAARLLRSPFGGCAVRSGTDLFPRHAAVARAVHVLRSVVHRLRRRAAKPPSARRAGTGRSASSPPFP